MAALGLPGIGFIKESKRTYPNSDLASHVLGYVGVDNVGLSGIEAAYDSLILGRAGTVLVERDARGSAFSRVERPPTAGAALELTIDEYLQHVAERELRAGVKWAGAPVGRRSSWIPITGEILALANAPDFNPNAYRDAREELRRNRAIQDIYEPGSTFKIVTASAAFEERAATPSTIIDASAGNIRFGKRVINDDHNYGVLSFAQAIIKSSNVGAIKVALKLGPEKVSDYVRRFGFGKPTSPDFRGESPGIVWDPSKLTDSALASVAMGYQVGVTPLQMAQAVSVVANGGELVQPRVVRAVIRDRRLPVPRKVIARPITTNTAATLTQIMEGVVTEGTGKAAQIPGYTVAGKTGTAKKLVNGSYRGHSDYNVSFVGFVPAQKPVFAIVVVVDSPHRVSPYGGVVAAPIFQKIAETALRHLRACRSRSMHREPLFAVRPGDNHGAAGLRSSHTDRGSCHSVDRRGAITSFPDLTGMSARDALRVLAQLGMTARLQGTGVVTQQYPPAGEPIESASTVVLKLGRRIPIKSRARPTMTVGDLLRALDRVPGLAHSPLPGSGAALDAQCTGVTHDSSRVGTWRDFRRRLSG